MTVSERCDYCCRWRGEGHSKRCGSTQFGEHYSVHRPDLEAELERLREELTEAQDAWERDNREKHEWMEHHREQAAEVERLRSALAAVSGGLGMIEYSRGVGAVDLRDMARGFKAEADAALNAPNKNG